MCYCPVSDVLQAGEEDKLMLHYTLKLRPFNHVCKVLGYEASLKKVLITPAMFDISV
jgi:hypothetical protein